MALTPLQESVLLTLVFLVGLAIGIWLFVLREEFPWPLYVYVAATAFGTLFWGFKAIRQYSG